jgi:hypothetical protein
MFMAQPRLLASASAAWTAPCAFCSEIGGPYGVAFGILSGIASRFGGAGGGCWALAAPVNNKVAQSVMAVRIGVLINVISQNVDLQRRFLSLALPC